MLNLILDICALRLLNMCVHRDMKNFNKKYQGLGDMPSSRSGISRSGVDRFGTLTAFPCLVCSIAYVRNCKIQEDVGGDGDSLVERDRYMELSSWDAYRLASDKKVQDLAMGQLAEGDVDVCLL